MRRADEARAPRGQERRSPRRRSKLDAGARRVFCTSSFVVVPKPQLLVDQCPQSGESFVRLTKKTRSTTYIPEARNATSLSRDHNDDALLPRRRRRAWRERAAQQSTEREQSLIGLLGCFCLLGWSPYRYVTIVCATHRSAPGRAGGVGDEKAGERERPPGALLVVVRRLSACRPTTNRARRRARA